MARQNALSIVTSASAQAQLAESYGQVIENVQKNAISEQLKAKQMSGDPTTGSVEFQRFENAVLEDYGTARTASAGAKLKADPVTVNIDTDKEIVEEVEDKDIEMFGVAGVVDRRKANHAQRLIAYLDREFFAVLDSSASAVDLTGVTGIANQLEHIIVALETVNNNYVDGVPRELMALTVKPHVYSTIRNYIDTTYNASVNNEEESVNLFHGVRIFSNFRQTNDVLISVDGAVAQPVVADTYDVERIPLSNAFALEMFLSKGTKALTPELVLKATIA